MLELKKGTQLANRYSLIRRLSGGGESNVWLAKDRLTSASIALKLSPDRDRLREEWQLGIRLMHAHIVRAFEFHDDDNLAFFSQQYIDGPDIATLAGHSASDILGPLGLIADALRYLHAKGIVHRDIKASNVLLDSNGAPYLLDFGVAAKIGVIVGAASGIAATPQSLAGEPAQAADDIFAFGGLMHELLTGRSPYSSSETLRDIREALPAAVERCNGEALPNDITILLAEMLHKDAARRPDAVSIAERLRAAGFAPGAAPVRSAAVRAAKDEVVEAVSSTAIGHIAAARKPNPTVVDSGGIGRGGAILGLASLLVLLAAVIVFLPEKVEERAAASDVEPVVENDPTTIANTTDTAGVADDRRTLVGEDITFSENSEDFSDLDSEDRARVDAEAALGELLSALQVLEGRAADRWAPIEYRASKDFYAAGDKAYLDKDFAAARRSYEEAQDALEPLYERIEPMFQKAYADAIAAFDAGNRVESLQAYELAVAITPSHPGALAGYERAKNLESVLSLVEQGLDYENNLELEAAASSFERAVAIDALWEPALLGLQRVQQARTKMEFDFRMSDGFVAIADGDYLAARAAFRVAQTLLPNSSEPADGLLQVEQGLRLQEIRTLEQEVLALERDEHWDAVVKTYEELLKVDSTLSFASAGLAEARKMAALHTQLDGLIAEPDKLSVPQRMQGATQLLVSITTRPDVGPRLASQRDELSRLLKRAATPLSVPLLSDNVTDVTIYRIGRLGSFMRTEVSLRPGNYVAVGVRPGYRDVRQEFRVAPEVSLEPIVVRCEEPI